MYSTQQFSPSGTSKAARYSSINFIGSSGTAPQSMGRTRVCGEAESASDNASLPEAGLAW
jgi:hypothetical protein